MAVREATQGRVLVVEDDESTALFVTRVLTRNGFEASWVTDAEQASERLGREAFDVLLADFRLPGSSGMDLARHTRQSMPSLSIAVMTSFADSHTEQTALSSGADDFFEKPLHSSNFVARIGALVTRSRAAGERAGSPPARGTLQAGPVESAPGASPRS
ncbi:MAG: response regulator transcription factor, partial [Acidimicrobiales bacterium]